MEIQLHNIGVIQDASIKLDGLTVITGKNETGKTTVGKALYALIDAVSDLPEKTRRDRNAYVWEQLRKIIDHLTVLRVLPTSSDALTDYPTLLHLSDPLSVYKLRTSNTNLEELAFKVSQELKLYQQRFESGKLDIADSSVNALMTAIGKFVPKHIQDLEKMFIAINQDPELIHYARESIHQTLNVEFSGQTQPLNAIEKQSGIQLTDQETAYFDIIIWKNHVTNENAFFYSPFKSVYMVDDPFILDQLSPFDEYVNFWEDDSSFEEGNSAYDPFMRSHVDKEGFLKPTGIKNHRERLSDLLYRLPHISVLEQTILNTTLRPVTEKMDQVLPGTFNFEGGYYIREDGTKLRISNLAAGSKMFSIVKILLEHGLLNEDTLLILDEPETYLHPKWQNQFAEIIVLLVKELRVKVLLTTHSSNFMLAIDAYMRKYEINDVSNFYHTRQLENGFVVHDCVNDNMEEIYGDFLDYLSEAKVLRDRYLTDDEEEIW